MFKQLLDTVTANITTIRAVVQTNETLRAIAFKKSSTFSAQVQDNKEDLSTLLNGVPDRTQWRIYDHCAVVIRLYAIYERFVEDLISEWLRDLPNLVPNYSNLEDRVQNTHREGVGRLLLELRKNRFQHLSMKDILHGLYQGMAGDRDYQLIPEAFLFHEQNLRKEVLDKMFADAGIPNAWTWVKNYRTIKQFVEKSRGSQNTAEAELKQLIQYRNDAAHGAEVSQILSSQELLDLGEFVTALCEALAELVTYRVVMQQTTTKKAREIGTIGE
ncbi:MAE_28990/MAE_18760 family HEPN-like nuclease [Phormidium sp. CCY1219]|uniref:MAE_28990/MAE_18760 family HEPN-like nuclease n=1 Tax=Phormidium sp. CCY1219 TaxID=2886104 RepID=UPI002D1EF865|nr:MAE_28990/MAE_18760 family HEPN-like nuclease [Phormidium sp. CCY1219]MEB3830000.1 hypothetical protein [Phormidium sp. CCY1219]